MRTAPCARHAPESWGCLSGSSACSCCLLLRAGQGGDRAGAVQPAARRRLHRGPHEGAAHQALHRARHPRDHCVRAPVQGRDRRLCLARAVRAARLQGGLHALHAGRRRPPPPLLQCAPRPLPRLVPWKLQDALSVLASSRTLAACKPSAQLPHQLLMPQVWQYIKPLRQWVRKHKRGGNGHAQPRQATPPRTGPAHQHNTTVQPLAPCTPSMRPEALLKALDSAAETLPTRTSSSGARKHCCKCPAQPAVAVRNSSSPVLSKACTGYLGRKSHYQQLVTECRADVLSPASSHSGAHTPGKAWAGFQFDQPAVMSILRAALHA